MFDLAVRQRWARLMGLRDRGLPQPAARGETGGSPTGRDAGRPDPQVASACHRLGLVAQALEHPVAAESWHLEALKAAADLKDHGLVARSAHQLAELCQRQGRGEEAAAWSALSLAGMAVAPRRSEGRGLKAGAGIAGHVELGAVERIWRGATGKALPARLRSALEDGLGVVPDRPAVAAGPARGAQATRAAASARHG